MERAFRRDFGGVRVVEDPAVAARGALAYTRGSQIRFAPGGFRPAERFGRALLAHELTHVVQQGEGRVAAKGHTNGLPVNADHSLEAEADLAAERVVRGEHRTLGPQAAPEPASFRASPGAAPPAQMAWKKWARRIGLALLAGAGAAGAGLLAAGAGLAAAPIALAAIGGGLAGGLLGYGAYRAYKAYKNRGNRGYGAIPSDLPLTRPRLPSDAEAAEMGGGLGEENIHFGINDPALGRFGRRSEAMTSKGGTVAEYAFAPHRHTTHAQTDFDRDLAAFHQTFNRQIPVRPSQLPKYTAPGLRNYTTGSGARSKYFRIESSSGSRARELGTRYGTRFSKASIPFSILRGGRPRFHLDNMQGIDDILAKRGPRADAVTSRELRFVHRYWDRPLEFHDESGRPTRMRMRDHVMFYNNLRRVPAPW